MQFLMDENQRLREQAQFAGFDVCQFQQPIVVHNVQVPNIDLSAIHIDQGITKPAKDTKPSEERTTPATGIIPFLSPLPLAIDISSPVSTVITFAPLPENDSDAGQETGANPVQTTPEMPSPLVEPIPPRHRTPLPPSGLSRTRPAELEIPVGHDSPHSHHPTEAIPIAAPTTYARRLPSSSSLRTFSSEGHSRSAGTRDSREHRGRSDDFLLGAYDDPVQGERHRSLQLQEILSSPPNSANRPSSYTQQVELEARHRVHASQQQTSSGQADSSLRPRNESSATTTSRQPCIDSLDPPVPSTESRFRACSEASSRPRSGLAGSTGVAAHAHHPTMPDSRSSKARATTAPVSSSLRDARLDFEVPRVPGSELRPRTHSEQSHPRPQLSRNLTEGSARTSDSPLGPGHVTQPTPMPRGSSHSANYPAPSVVSSSSSSSPSASSSSCASSSSSSPMRLPAIRHDGSSSRPALSTASHVAQALEKEQKERKAEKERERERAEFERMCREEQQQQLQEWERNRAKPRPIASVIQGPSSGYGSPASFHQRSATSGIVAAGNGNGKSRMSSTSMIAAGMGYA
jgi:hypothetical protein